VFFLGAPFVCFGGSSSWLLFHSFVCLLFVCVVPSNFNTTLFFFPNAKFCTYAKNIKKFVVYFPISWRNKLSIFFNENIILVTFLFKFWLGVICYAIINFLKLLNNSWDARY
jgi:hypothetical protein